MYIDFNAEVDVEEVGKLLDLIVALKTKMQEWDMKSVEVYMRDAERAEKVPNVKAPKCSCSTCRYEKLPAYEEPCKMCTGNSKWEAKDK